MNRHHKSLTLKKWSQYPLSKQILSIGSELSRVLHLSDKELQRKCLERAFELIDLTAADPKLGSGRREVLILRQMLRNQYIDSVDLTQIKQYYQYCLDFAKCKL